MKKIEPTNMLPLSETAFYIMLSLLEPRHGYGVMQHVQILTNNRVVLGAGTLYGSLSRMEKDGLINSIAEEERRKIYQVSEAGRKLLSLELARLEELCRNGRQYMEATR